MDLDKMLVTDFVALATGTTDYELGRAMMIKRAKEELGEDFPGCDGIEGFFFAGMNLYRADFESGKRKLS